MTAKTIFTIRVVYKSGYTHDFDVTEFSIKGDDWSWVPADPHIRPIMVGIDEVAAVWQIATSDMPYDGYTTPEGSRPRPADVLS